MTTDGIEQGKGSGKREFSRGGVREPLGSRAQAPHRGVEQFDSAASIWGHVEISEYRTLRKSDLSAMNALLRELNADAPASTLPRLQNICAAPNMHLLVIRNEVDVVIGMATLEIAETLMGTYGYAHDVVVSSDYRGKGLGRMLMEKLIAAAKELGCRHIDLTSNPKRATGAFYLSLGFVKRDTDCYRKELP